MVIITVDTSKDAPDEIRRAIRYLEESIGLKDGETHPAEHHERIEFLELFGDSVEAQPVEAKPQAAAPAQTQQPEKATGAPKHDAASILKEAERKIPEKKPIAEAKKDVDETKVQLDDDSQETFIEIVEYD